MNGIIVFLGLLFILYIGRAIFVPLLLAAFLWYLLNAISSYYRKIMPFYKFIFGKSEMVRECRAQPSRPNCYSVLAGRVFDILSMLLSLATFGGLLYLFIAQIQPMFVKLAGRLPEIQHRLRDLVEYAGSSFGMSFADSLPDLMPMFTGLGLSAAQMAGTLGLVMVYIFFMFIEQSTFGSKLQKLFPEKRRFSKVRYILHSIDENMKKYMFMKTLVSVVTAVSAYFWMNHLGLEFAGVWAFIIFIMNYIPTFGTIIASAMPIIYALLISDNFAIPILVATGLIAIQVILGNIIEPRLTGRTLNLSTLAILINLVFWGMLWGPVGMFFSVPLLVATFIITSQFDGTRPIAVLLSANGEIPDKKGD